MILSRSFNVRALIVKTLILNRCVSVAITKSNQITDWFLQALL
jgi:hypothetical protein